MVKGMIVYNKLWQIMNEKGVSQYRLKAEGVSNSTLTRLKRNEPVSTETLNKLCQILKCNVGDLADYFEDSDTKEARNCP